jgi:hypothetical protein
MCADPAHFTPTAQMQNGATCATMQASFIHADLYGFSTLCDVVPDANDGFTWGAKFASAAGQCCTGPIANTCSTTASPTLAPTLSPASTSSSSGSSGTGTLLSETVAIIIVATLVIVFIGIAVYGYQRHTSIVKDRDTTFNPMYEEP